MKRMYPVLLLFFAIMSAAPLYAQNTNVGIGTTTPNASAVLDVTSNTQGMLVPRMTTAQRTAIATPAEGLLVYDTNIGCFYFYKSGTWTNLCQAGPAGPQGPTGAAGTPGTPGPSGANGTPGVTGPSGADGANGATGLQGVPGIPGTPGATGATGPQGPIGPGGAGSLGPTGANGPIGPTGPQGVAGANGATGIAGPTGANGTPGATGPAGATGAAGVTGPSGTGGNYNIHSTSLATDVTLNATTQTTLPGLSLTFTPTTSTVFVEFSASGAGAQGGEEQAIFQLAVNGTPVAGSGCVSLASISFNYQGGTNELYGWNAVVTKMLTVTPNVSTTITVQYLSESLNNPTGLSIDANSSGYSHATLTAFVQ